MASPLLRAPVAPSFLAQQLSTLVVAVSHKHNRLPTPYRKGETVSCLSWSSFKGDIHQPPASTQ
jgi:hypothetical protein